MAGIELVARTFVRSIGQLSAADAGAAAKAQRILVERIVAERNATGLVDDMAIAHHPRPRPAQRSSLELMESAATAVQPTRVLTPQQAAIRNMQEINRSNLERAKHGVVPGASRSTPSRDLHDLWSEGGYAQTGRITPRTPEQLLASTTRAEARAAERILERQAAAAPPTAPDWAQLMWDADRADALIPLR
ncbi:MAG: hypothetical protein H7287_01545 [Thermoleophilia bacterium]|nr:hypothetical protein [Thermoleophilia bacterium]